MILSETGMAITPSAGVGWAPLGVELAIRKNRARVPKMVPTASVVSCCFLLFLVVSYRAIFGSKLISHAVPAETFGAKLGTLSRPRRTKVPTRLGCRSEEHTSELQSLMRISYAVFCL